MMVWSAIAMMRVLQVTYRAVVLSVTPMVRVLWVMPRFLGTVTEVSRIRNGLLENHG